MAVNAQVLSARHGEAVSVVLTGEDNTDPTAYAMSFVVSVGPGNTALVTVSTPTITVSGSGPYVVTCPLTRAHTGTTLIGRDNYAWALWRTDSGSERQLAGGTLILDDAVYSPS
jgi:hypothetical protein